MPQAHGAVEHGITPAGFRSPGIVGKIAFKELVPIILSCVRHGGSPGMPARFGADVTIKLVAALWTRSCRDARVMRLLRCLVFIEAQLGC